MSPVEMQERVAVECRAATIGCVDDKKLLAEQMIAYLEPFQRRRAELFRDRDTLFDILVAGSKKARERAAETMELVRQAISFDYRRESKPVEKAVKVAAP
jgi:tryptophanyl-tRNA synthetase